MSFLKNPARILESRKYYAYSAVIIVAGVLLRLYHLGNFSFWDDELFSISNVLRAGPWNGPLIPDRSMSHLQISDSFWTWKLADPHPPLFEMLLVPWIAFFGASEFAVRSLSVIFGLATMLSALALPRNITQPTRLVYLLLLAISGCLVIYSQEARNYSLCACLSAWMLVCLLRDMEYSPVTLKEGRVSITLMMLGGLLAMTHYYGLVFTCSVALYTLIQVRSPIAFFRHSLRWLASLMPTLIYISLGWVGILTKLDAAPAHPLSFAMAFKRNVLGMLRNFFPGEHGSPAFWAFIFVLSIAGGLAYFYRRSPHPLRPAITMLAIVLAVFFTVQVVGTRRAEFIHERYMVFMVPGCLLLVALATQLRGWPKIANWLMILALIPASILVWRQSPKPQGFGDWRGGALLTAGMYRSGDVILVPMDQPVLMSYFQHYLRNYISVDNLDRDMVGGLPTTTLVDQVRQRDPLPSRIIVFTHYAFRHTTNVVIDMLKTDLQCNAEPLQSAQALQVIQMNCAPNAPFFR